ncbi:MAG: glycosyltransferase family 4 protein, partial [Erysipelotrichaceae bacterium]|nr:glycosyltransferase family 4 protein [Erysipelotrichaceae bacterium]
MKKILVVSQYYYPEEFQINAICEGLVKLNYHVDVITGLPNYPEGHILKDYKRFKNRKEVHNGVFIERNSEVGRRNSAIFLILNYISFSLLSSLKYLFKKKQFDLVFIYQLSPVLSALPGIILGKRYGKPVVLYCCDIWPESIKTLGIGENNLIFKLGKVLSHYVYKNCNKIIVQSPSFINYFKDEIGIDKSKVEYIPQFADTIYLKQDYYTDNMVKNIVFLGNIGYAQNLELLIDSLEYVKKDNYKIHLVGSGSDLKRLENQVNEKGLAKKVIFYGRQPVEKMSDFYKIADICFLSLRIDNKTGLTIPSKLQGYMAAGKPVLAA